VGKQVAISPAALAVVWRRLDRRDCATT
jgi:hypothetical protein